MGPPFGGPAPGSFSAAVRGRAPPGMPENGHMAGLAPHHQQALAAHQQAMAAQHQQPGAPLRRSRYEGKLMSGEEVEHIMHIMYAAVHSGMPYCEDYYYQAYVNRHSVARNTSSFQPESLRDLTADVAKLDPSASVKFVNLDGLGKIVLSNIRTPKVLMDLTSTGDVAKPGGGGAEGDSSAPAKPLEQEPLLAARIMVEDCMHLLLDVDDIDRCFAAAAARSSVPQDGDGLRKRRALLAAGIAASFRLPDTPAGILEAAAADSEAAALGDGVFLRIMALPKGRTLLARSLRTLLSQPPGAGKLTTGAEQAASSVEMQGSLGPQHLLWAMLRNVRRLFGASGLQAPDAAAEKALTEATHRLAAATREAIGKLTTPKQVTDALAALIAGVQQQPGAGPMDALLPLANTRGVGMELAAGVPRDWLGEVLASLLQRAEQVGAGGSDAAGGWQACMDALVAAHMRHLEALQPVHAAAQVADNASALSLVRALACRPLAQALVPHVSQEQRSRIHDFTLRFLS